MTRSTLLSVALCLLRLSISSARGEVKVVQERIDNAEATAAFAFARIPAPAIQSAATKATWKIIQGARDPAGAEVDALHSATLPSDPDQPAANFFFNAGTDGGRIMADLGEAIDIRQVNTYSWHAGTRAPQVFTLYASDGAASDFQSEPGKAANPVAHGWKLLAKVDTRPKNESPGGQYGVCISDSLGSLGNFRYLLFEMAPTETEDRFGNTFYSHIDVISSGELLREPAAPAPRPGVQVVSIEQGKYRAVIDTSETPDLSQWARHELAPVVSAWYPRLIKMLPSDGFEPPSEFSITFRQAKQGVADTVGTRINCAAAWFGKNLEGEARGAVVHEMVHVVQQYGRRRRPGHPGTQSPGWLVEGIADYIRFYKYEPRTRGAAISRQSASGARYDGSYRITANFLDWTAQTFDHDLVPKLNACLRDGTYEESFWTQRTGRSLAELGEAWKKNLQKPDDPRAQ